MHGCHFLDHFLVSCLNNTLKKYLPVSPAKSGALAKWFIQPVSGIRHWDWSFSSQKKSPAFAGKTGDLTRTLTSQSQPRRPLREEHPGRFSDSRISLLLVAFPPFDKLRAVAFSSFVPDYSGGSVPDFPAMGVTGFPAWMSKITLKLTPILHQSGSIVKVSEWWLMTTGNPNSSNRSDPERAIPIPWWLTAFLASPIRIYSIFKRKIIQSYDFTFPY